MLACLASAPTSEQCKSNRTFLPRSLYFVGGTSEDIVERLWAVITTGDQWTKVTKSILDNMCIEGDGVREEEVEKNVLDLASLHPFAVSDVPLPQSKVCRVLQKCYRF